MRGSIEAMNASCDSRFHQLLSYHRKFAIAILYYAEDCVQDAL